MKPAVVLAFPAPEVIRAVQRLERVLGHGFDAERKDDSLLLLETVLEDRPCPSWTVRLLLRVVLAAPTAPLALKLADGLGKLSNMEVRAVGLMLVSQSGKVQRTGYLLLRGR